MKINKEGKKIIKTVKMKDGREINFVRLFEENELEERGIKWVQ